MDDLELKYDPESKKNTILVKLYKNRKYYIIEGEYYATLDDIANIIKNGDDIKVLSHVTGEDLTFKTKLKLLNRFPELLSSIGLDKKAA
jgi:polyhydroxyalkanoate synthesis regulator protein